MNFSIKLENAILEFLKWDIYYKGTTLKYNFDNGIYNRLILKRFDNLKQYGYWLKQMIDKYKNWVNDKNYFNNENYF